jgi:hypothetical protein
LEDEREDEGDAYTSDGDDGTWAAVEVQDSGSDGEEEGWADFQVVGLEDGMPTLRQVQRRDGGRHELGAQAACAEAESPGAHLGSLLAGLEQGPEEAAARDVDVLPGALPQHVCLLYSCRNRHWAQAAALRIVRHALGRWKTIWQQTRQVDRYLPMRSIY